MLDAVQQDIAGRNQANPLGAIACAALVLGQIGQQDAAEEEARAIRAAIREGVTTTDRGGSAGTEEVGRWIADHLGGSVRGAEG